MNRLYPVLAAALAWVVFWGVGSALQNQPRVAEESQLSVRMPLVLQLAYAGGDPYLAANLNVFRSKMVDVATQERETYRVQAALQRDAAHFNPRHEDNYYLAAALLPWNGFVAESQDILRLAAESRPWDWIPPFYYAFGSWYFERAPLRAGEWAEVAAQRSNEVNAVALRAMAARWYEGGEDPDLARRLIEAMLAETQDASLRLQLQVRLMRLEGLMALRVAHADFLARHGRAPVVLEDLIGYGGLQAVPADPLRMGYLLDERGVPALAVTPVAGRR